MNKHSCILCNNSDVAVIEKVRTKEIIKAYEKSLNVPVKNLFVHKYSLLEFMVCKNCDLKWYEPLISGDAGFYESLQQHEWYYQDHKPEYDFAKMKIKEGDNVLEIGCGKGMFGLILPNGIKYKGLEFNQEAVLKATSAGLNVEIDTIENHADKNQAVYDVVCHFQVLEHVENPRHFLECCVKALKPGGLLIVAVPSEDSFLSIVESGWLNMPPHHITRWSDKSLTFALNALKLGDFQFWHEPVATYHKAWHRSTIIHFGLKRLFGFNTSLIKNKLLSRVAVRLEKMPFLGNFLFKIGANKFNYAKRGHTVCAIANKK